MTTIRVALGERSYSIHTAATYGQLPAALGRLRLPPVGWIVTHRSVMARHGRLLLDPLRRAGWALDTLEVPEQERSKSLAMAQRIIERLARRAAMRVPLLFAFGGGVVGDLTGFVAATFRRGIPYVQLPTTLLAQVDSAIGGKVGVDLPYAKNLVGAFYQPRLVYNNLSVLATLPLRQRRSGLAEVIKYGVIADPILFTFVERHLRDCLSLRSRALQVMVARSCRIKARVVAQDERETTGARAHLNFGHTVGHALEAAGGYRRWTHGEAIAIGMCAAARLSAAMGHFPASDCGRVIRLFQAAGLPTRAGGIELKDVLRLLRYDKKFIHGRPRWVLPTRIGRVVVTEAVPPTVVRRVIAEHVVQFAQRLTSPWRAPYDRALIEGGEKWPSRGWRQSVGWMDFLRTRWWRSSS